MPPLDDKSECAKNLRRKIINIHVYFVSTFTSHSDIKAHSHLNSLVTTTNKILLWPLRVIAPSGEKGCVNSRRGLMRQVLRSAELTRPGPTRPLGSAGAAPAAWGMRPRGRRTLAPNHPGSVQPVVADEDEWDLQNGLRGACEPPDCHREGLFTPRRERARERSHLM